MHFSFMPFNNLSKHKQEIFDANHHLDEVTSVSLKILAFLSSLVLLDGKIKKYLHPNPTAP